MASKHAARYAIYWTPAPGDPLLAAGQEWLGRDARSNTEVGHSPQGLSAAVWRRLVARPSGYGFHATLRAPIRLADGVGEHDLVRTVSQLASRLSAVSLARLGVGWLGDFLALRPIESDHGASANVALRDLADAVMQGVDPLRAPPTPAELARHDDGSLTARRRALLHRWGYLHVAEQYRFHLTLTGALGGKTVESQRFLQSLLERHFKRALEAPRCLDALTIFVQPAPDDRFVVLERLPLSNQRGHPLPAARSGPEKKAQIRLV